MPLTAQLRPFLVGSSGIQNAANTLIQLEAEEFIDFGVGQIYGRVAGGRRFHVGC
jgi:hypothetical protein